MIATAAFCQHHEPSGNLLGTAQRFASGSRLIDSAKQSRERTHKWQQDGVFVCDRIASYDGGSHAEKVLCDGHLLFGERDQRAHHKLLQKGQRHIGFQLFGNRVLEGKRLDEIEAAREEGKRPYQKIIIVAAFALIALTVEVIMLFFFAK
ncbi:MAG: hypothetical protein IK059_00530 [Firmicutes bacterium]|nr:hypothetical protein [Bacillota bacterium]